MLSFVITYLDEEQIYLLKKNKHYKIGRRTTSDIIINDRTVSGEHARLFVEDDKLFIEDLQSRNGTKINNNLLSGKTEIKINQKILIGMRQTYIQDISEKELMNLQQLDDNLFVRKAQFTSDNLMISEAEDADLSNTIVSKIEFKNIDKKNIDIDNLLNKKDAQLDQAYQKLSIVYEMSRVANNIMDKKKLYTLALEWIKKGLKYDRGYILMREDNNIICECSNVEDKEIVFSTTIANKVIDEQIGIITVDASQDERFNSSASIANLKITSAMCVPVWIQEQTVGLIYIDNSVSSQQFVDEDLKFLSAFANQLSLSLERINLIKTLQEEEKIKNNLQRYLSPDVANVVINNPDIVKLGGERAYVSVLFADIRSFTTLSRQIPVDLLVTMLNEYFTVLVDIVFINKGTIDKFIGDAIMAVFGAPIFFNGIEYNSINVAIEIQKKLKDLRINWQKKYGFQFNIGIGIASGEVIAGNVGSKERMEYTILGNAVNLAARICSASPPDKIYICPNTFKKTKDSFQFSELEPIKFKGIEENIKIYNVLY